MSPLLVLEKQIQPLAHIIQASRAFAKPLDVSYDNEADVLYISFGKPKRAADSEAVSEHIVVRKDKAGRAIGYTVRNASEAL